ncbi:MAG TPA: tyrosine-type recombinase/integrase [Balneolales bacterium]|nr:tyrosine-type recombinase/integrase [Balneolales bacterium]
MKVTDIDSDRMLIRIDQSKEQKGWYSNPSEKLLVLLRRYVKEYDRLGICLKGRMAANICSSYSGAYEPTQKATRHHQESHAAHHKLRHSFATHLPNNGMDT